MKVTLNDINRRVKELNDIVGKKEGEINSYYLSQMNGAYAIVEKLKEGGAIKDIGGYGNKNEVLKNINNLCEEKYKEKIDNNNEIIKEESSINEDTKIKYSIAYEITTDDSKKTNDFAEIGFKKENNLTWGKDGIDLLNIDYKFVMKSKNGILTCDDSFNTEIIKEYNREIPWNKGYSKDKEEKEINKEGCNVVYRLFIKEIDEKKPTNENMYDIARILGINLNYKKEDIKLEIMECSRYERKYLSDLEERNILEEMGYVYITYGNNIFSIIGKNGKIVVGRKNECFDKEKKEKLYVLERIDDGVIRGRSVNDYWFFKRDFNDISANEFVKQYDIWEKEKNNILNEENNKKKSRGRK